MNEWTEHSFCVQHPASGCCYDTQVTDNLVREKEEYLQHA